MTALTLALLLEASLPPPRDWMAVRNGAVELALAHRETDHLDGDRARSDARFVIQFNKYMDDDSFAGHVLLRYADSPTSGGFPTLKLAYDEGKRALVIDPGVALEPGRHLECRLLSGIVDADGLALVPRQGTAAPDVIDVLHFEVER